MPVKRKITSCHGVDSRPLSECMRRLTPRRERGPSLCTASPDQNSWRPRKGVSRATRTDFQLSRRRFKIPAPGTSESPLSRPRSRAPTSKRAVSCPSTSSATAPGFPTPTRAFVARSPSHHHGKLLHRWHASVRCHKAERCPSAQNHRFSLPEPSVPTAATSLGELNPEQRRGLEHGVTQDCTIGPPLLLVAGAELAKPTP